MLGSDVTNRHCHQHTSLHTNINIRSSNCLKGKLRTLSCKNVANYLSQISAPTQDRRTDRQTDRQSVRDRQTVTDRQTDRERDEPSWLTALMCGGCVECCRRTRRHFVVSSNTAVWRHVWPRSSTTFIDAPQSNRWRTVSGWSVNTATCNAVCHRPHVHSTTHKFKRPGSSKSLKYILPDKLINT